jgi:hypothetical protein
MLANGFEDVEILDVSAGIFTSIREALLELQAGRMIVIVDDDRSDTRGYNLGSSVAELE